MLISLISKLLIYSIYGINLAADEASLLIIDVVLNEKNVVITVVNLSVIAGVRKSKIV
jgi:hypothetical protein